MVSSTSTHARGQSSRSAWSPRLPRRVLIPFTVGRHPHSRRYSQSAACRREQGRRELSRSQDPELIRRAAGVFGSQCIVVR